MSFSGKVEKWLIFYISSFSHVSDLLIKLKRQCQHFVAPLLEDIVGQPHGHRKVRAGRLMGRESGIPGRDFSPLSQFN